MRRKMRSRWGFTLIEVLVVVALIVILIAISIPAVMGVLNNARHKTDAKYERAAKALATGLWQANSLPKGEGGSAAYQFLYDAENGKLVVYTASLTGSAIFDQSYPPYGQCRKTGQEHAGKRLWVNVDLGTGEIKLTWEAKLTGTYTEEQWNKNLCSNE